MIKINFKNLEVQFEIEGAASAIDVRKEIGNYLYKVTTDIAMSDFGREIYYSEGEVEIPDTLLPSFKELINGSNFIAPVKRSILKI